MSITANVLITTYLRESITYLKDSYTCTPFKLANVREDHSQPCLELMLVSSSPGILDGDAYTLKIEVKEACALHLQTQSYQRIFNMKNSAKQYISVELGAKAFFQFVPHPTVPHKNSNFIGTNDIYLQKDSSVIWSDLISCGRKLNGEQFEYTLFENKTTFYLEKKPVISEHICFQPAIKSPMSLGQLENYTHAASLFLIHPKLDIKKLKQQIKVRLTEVTDITFGQSELSINGLVLKVLANGAERLHQVITELTYHIRKEHFNL